jgi:hypothetical protein
MKNGEARELGQQLKPVLERLRALAKRERASRGPDAEAIEIAVVNLDSAIEILTE